MDELDKFRILKEIQSLMTKRNEIDKDFINQEKRIETLIKRREQLKEDLKQIIDDLKTYKSKEQELNQELDLQQKNLNSAQNNFNQATSESEQKAFEDQIKKATEKKALIEEQIFSTLVYIEENSEKKNEIQEYLQNSEKSLQDIDSEVKANQNEITNHRNNLTERIKSLISEIPESSRGSLKNLLNKKQTICSSLKAQNCESCGMQQTGEMIQRLESKKELIRCSGCKCFLLPFGL